MRLLDRYFVSELARAAFGGLVLFLGLVVGVYQLQDFLRLLIREDYPLGAAAKCLVYAIPQNVGWVLPVAVIFGTIMAVGRMSADGELIAMHAGGISFRRMLVPVALLGLLSVGVLYVVTECVAPRALAANVRLALQYGSKGKQITGFQYTHVEDNQVVRHVFASSLDPRTQTLIGVVITEYRDGQPQEVVTAQSATWQGTWLRLAHVETTRLTPRGPLTLRAEEARHEIGRLPDTVEHKPEYMTIGEMRAWIADARRQIGSGPDRGRAVAQRIRPYEQAIAVRRATPWCALGFALVSAPLGLRRVRASTGVSLGIAVIVFVPYYFVSYTLQVLNKHGGIPPEIPAWTGNVLLFIVAAGLILDRSR